jgi:uncharacterized membrane protein YidH (DUF202 family)
VTRVADGGLQVERTALAWRRLGSALVVAVLAAGRLCFERWPAAAVAVLAVGMPLALAVRHGSDHRYRRAHAALHRDQPLPDGRLPFAAAATVALLGAAGAWAVAVP